MQRRNEVGVMGKAGLEQPQEASWRWGLQASRRKHEEKYRAPEGTEEGCRSHVQPWKVLGSLLGLDEQKQLGTGPGDAKEKAQSKEEGRA